MNWTTVSRTLPSPCSLPQACTRARLSKGSLATFTRQFSAAGRRNGPYDFNSPEARPLDGVTVVALEQVISGPYCTRQLADLGARVIKIERPGTGDFVRYHDKRVLGQCSHFVWTNRNKESLELDVKKDEDIATLRKLLKKADVFVANLVPGATERLGLGYEKLKELNDRLIVCEISGYGGDGPYKKKKAYDLLVQSEAGLLSITGTPETASKVGASIADISAGMYAYSGIMAALLQRAKTGKGCYLDVSMLESMTEWMGFPMYYAMDGQPPPPRAGASHASIYPYGPFEAKDGTVMLGLQNEREWVILCEKVLDLPDLAKEERFINTDSRSNNRKELYPIICEALSRFTSAEATQRLEAAGIANANLNSMEDVWNHPQLHARRRFREMETEAGTVRTLIPPGMSADVEPRLDPVPSIGQHNKKIMAELDAQ
ncbi:Succinate--hydroxymethylglutarate CoA-transferase [Cyphellophora attinorum]|uniref:Succinate--hydroxymethylglutarate CoA-transferase n=1 Tax=Cyphellophora attinorum TaxID=1664694 RepID=A0A0N1HDQ6_9EURO|nr:Succinate--hydroxymethylglutarate CoA-transferase [Phialophora attinorum]KPI42675.1 Succinate--hydroxymethylglutarate CoA-transferase [Phialophora attinorum]